MLKAIAHLEALLMMKIKITYVYCRLRLCLAVPAGRLRFLRANCVESRGLSLCLLAQPWVPAVNICEIIGVGILTSGPLDQKLVMSR